MTDKPVIFKKEVVAKKNWYTRIKEIMIEAGWENISSRPSTDFDVLYSKGESGKTDMFIQLKEFDYTSTLSISSSTERTLYFRLPFSYTPGPPGQSGTFKRSTGQESWRPILVAFDLLDKETFFTIYFHCNKNRLILLNDFSRGLTKGTIQMIGISDRSLAEVEYSGPIVAATQLYDIPSGVCASSRPGFIRSSSYSLKVMMDIPPSFINLGFMSEIAYGDANEGIRGYIDGVYALHPDTRVISGDFVEYNGDLYRVIEVDGPFSTFYKGSFDKTVLYAFRTE